MIAVYYKDEEGCRGSFALCANTPSGSSGEKTLVDYLTDSNRCARGSFMKIFAESVTGIRDYSLQKEFKSPKSFFAQVGLVKGWIKSVSYFKRIFGNSDTYKRPKAVTRGDSAMVEAIDRRFRY